MQEKGIDILALLNVPAEYRSQIRVDISLEDLIQFAEHLIKGIQHNNPALQQKPDIGRIDLAMEVTGLTKSTIYTKVSKGEIPVLRRDGTLFFSRKMLEKWILEGKQLTNKEIQNNAASYLK
ncbi:MAG: helix-turn-helix domain-containing protein [Bacteroidales bacterium]|nr:helix-turn-helix domain-containing protein [Bacteroidales bacterium]